MFKAETILQIAFSVFKTPSRLSTEIHLRMAGLRKETFLEVTQLSRLYRTFKNGAAG